jgi:hypothetical protein
MNKHTPAPWMAHKWELENYKGVEVRDIQGNPICALANNNAEANAKLIAAAPELLEALQNVRQNMTAHIPEKVFDLVDNAIKKATE